MKSCTPHWIFHHRFPSLVTAALLLSGSSGLADVSDTMRLHNAFDDSMAIITDQPYSETNSPEEDIQAVEGTTEIFRERYADGKVKIEREVALDADGNYVNHGSWKMWDTTGLLIADGPFEMGKRVGSWTRMLNRSNTPLLQQPQFKRFKAPFISQVSFANDKMDGEWTLIDLEQRKCSQISLENGVRHGLATLWLPNGKVLRQTRYNQGVPVGDVLQTNLKTGELERVATFLDGRRIAKNVTKQGRNQQKQTEEMYLAPTTVQSSFDNFWNSRLAQYQAEGESLLHGKSRAWYSNGQLQWEGEYQYDSRIGRFQYWHANGQLAAEGNYRKGEYDSRWNWWHENGQKAITGNYDDGQLIGEWRWWDEMGKLANRMTYNGTESLSSQDFANDDLVEELGSRLPELELIR